MSILCPEGIFEIVYLTQYFPVPKSRIKYFSLKLLLNFVQLREVNNVNNYCKFTFLFRLRALERLWKVRIILPHFVFFCLYQVLAKILMTHAEPTSRQKITKSSKPSHKDTAWTYNFVETSMQNHESSQTWGFRIQCLQNKPISNHFCSGRGGGDKIR
jgi:hypothetical protein